VLGRPVEPGELEAAFEHALGATAAVAT